METQQNNFLNKVKKVHNNISVQQLCKLLGYSPQAYHKYNKKQFNQQVNEMLISEQIDMIRKQPCCGGRKLFIMLQPFFKQHNITICKDKFFDVLKRNKLLVRKTKLNVYTTMSKHHYHCYPNLVKGFSPVKVHELRVADITYIPLKERFAYMF